jgi:hypothetical protein
MAAVACIANRGGTGRTVRRIRSTTFVRAAESVRRQGLTVTCRAAAVRLADGEHCLSRSEPKAAAGASCATEQMIGLVRSSRSA